MSLTRHALVRMQQRGIGADVIDDLLDYGRMAHDHRGAEIVFFDKSSRQRLARERGDEALRRLGNRLRAYLVIDTAGDVLTVGHRTRRIRRN
jgi:hypothetical protein